MSKKKTATTMAAKKILKKVQKIEEKTKDPCELGVVRHLDDILRGIIAGEKVSISIGSHTTIEYVRGDDDRTDVKSTVDFADNDECAESTQNETDEDDKHNDDEGTAE